MKPKEVIEYVMPIDENMLPKFKKHDADQTDSRFNANFIKSISENVGGGKYDPTKWRNGYLKVSIHAEEKTGFTEEEVRNFLKENLQLRDNFVDNLIKELKQG